MTSGLLSVLSREVGPNHEDQISREVYFLGLVANYLLWGVQIAQSYYYYRSYRTTDRAWLKGTISLLVITEALQTICTSVLCWRFLVQGLGDLPATEQPTGWGGDAIPFIDAFTAAIVHCLYAQKVWNLLRAPYNHICTGIILVLSCLQFTAGTGLTIFMSSINIRFSEFGRIKNWASIWLLTSAMTDIIITIFMTWSLSQRRTGIKSTNDIISKLIRMIIETGLATAVLQLLDIVLYLIWPLKPYHIVLAILGPKVYSNSMLALLNSRKTRKANSMCYTDQSTPAINVRASRTIDIVSDYEVGERRIHDLESGRSSFIQKSGS